MECVTFTIGELKGGHSAFPSFLSEAIVKSLTEMYDSEVASALNETEHSSKNFDSIIALHLARNLPDGYQIQRKVKVSRQARFEDDIAILGPDFVVSIEIEKGDKARLDLDLRKVETFAQHTSKPCFGVIIVPFNNALDRSITGTVGESSFHYLKRTGMLTKISAQTKAKEDGNELSPRELNQKDHISYGLDLLKKGLRPYVLREVKALYGSKDGKSHWSRSERNRPINDEDILDLLKLIINFWNEAFKTKLGRSERSLVSELLEVRHRWAHQEPFSISDVYRALDSMERLLTAVRSRQEAASVAIRRKQVLRLLSENESSVDSSHTRHYTNPVDILVVGYHGFSKQGNKIAHQRSSQPRSRDSIVDGTENRSISELASLFKPAIGQIVNNSTAFRKLRESVIGRLSNLKEKANINGAYVGYREGNSADHAYVYFQKRGLKVDLARPRSIETALEKVDVLVTYVNNYQGRAGWTTGIRLMHNASPEQADLVAREMVCALTDGN